MTSPSMTSEAFSVSVTTKVANSLPLLNRATVSNDLLSLSERLLLADYLGEMKTQAEISHSREIAQTTVSHRIRRAIEKLQAAGITIVLPGRGRRRSVTLDVAIDPGALGMLTESAGEGAMGRSRMRWVKA